MSDTPPMPQPTDEHKQLSELVGTWKVACKFFMDPSGEPMENEATEEVEMVGPFHIATTFKTDMFGMPFEGRCTCSYDPKLGKHISTWMDSMNPYLWHFEGEREGNGVLTMHADGPNPMGEGQAKFRSIEEPQDDGSRKWEMAVQTPDGGWFTMMQYHYTRG